MSGKVLCVIPARGGSKRIPKKNIADFMGKPLIAYSIEAATRTHVFDTIMVSTENQEIADVAKKWGAEVPFFRNEETANDTCGIADVILEVLDKYEELGTVYEYVACILATAPLIKDDNLLNAYNLLVNNKDVDSVVPVEKFSYPPQRCLVIRDGKLQMLYPENYYARSQDLESYYHDCGQFFFFKTEALRREKKLYTERSVPIIIDEMESQDIDNFEDFEIAKIKYKLMKGK